MPGPVAVLDPPRNARKAVQMMVNGKTQAEIGEAFGISRESVNRWANREDIKEWIQEQAHKYIESLPSALHVSRNVLDMGAHQTNEAITRDKDGKILKIDAEKIDVKILDAALRESEKIRQSVGINPSHAPSVVIGQLIIGDQTNVLAPNVQSLLDRQLGDVLDVTPDLDVPQDVVLSTGGTDSDN